MEEERYEIRPLGVPANQLVFNAEAAVTFTLVGTNLIALYRKEGEKNTFLVTPTDNTPKGGMSIEDMIRDINRFLHDYDPEAVQLDAEEVANAVKDVNDASKKEGSPVEQANIDYKKITVELRQAFLYLNTGSPIEYAFELDVDISGLFPEDVTFFNVKKLSIGVWNTNREQILGRMGIINFDTYLAVE